MADGDYGYVNQGNRQKSQQASMLSFYVTLNQTCSTTVASISQDATPRSSSTNA